MSVTKEYMSRGNSTRDSGLRPSPINNIAQECLHAANDRWKKFHADVEDPTKISRLGLGVVKDGWKWATAVSEGYFVVDKSSVSNESGVECMSHNWFRLTEKGYRAICTLTDREYIPLSWRQS
jgi:hypothetical protein